MVCLGIIINERTALHKLYLDINKNKEGKIFMKRAKRITALLLVIVSIVTFAIPAYATENSRTLTLPNSYGKLKAYAWIQSTADRDGSGLYKAYSQLTTGKSITGDKISISCKFYVNGIAASLSYYVGVNSNGPSASYNGGSWMKSSAKYVETPYGARVYGHGLWWYIGYTAFADLSAWGKNYQTSTKI